MSRVPFILLVMLVLGFEGGTLGQTKLRIGAWNIQTFGQDKINKPHIVDIIVKVMQRYDLVVILEVKDIDEKVALQLLNKLNEGITSDPYEHMASKRVAPGCHKEQYVFYWKSSRVSYNNSWTYNDSADRFVYDPFLAIFEWKVNNGSQKFGFIAIHTRPKDAVKEINALADVYTDFRSSGIDDVMILGDFNAGGTYVKTRDFANIRLWTDSTFTWLTSHQTGTSVGTYYPYDRIVVAGPALYQLTDGKAWPDYYDNEFGITDLNLVKEVSDHYPIYTLVETCTSRKRPRGSSC